MHSTFLSLLVSKLRDYICFDQFGSLPTQVSLSIYGVVGEVQIAKPRLNPQREIQIFSPQLWGNNPKFKSWLFKSFAKTGQLNYLLSGPFVFSPCPHSRSSGQHPVLGILLCEVHQRAAARRPLPHCWLFLWCLCGV